MQCKMGKWITTEKGIQCPKTKTLNNFMSELSLTDPWRAKHPKGKDFSFFSNVHNSYSRIDFFLPPLTIHV